MTTNIETDNPLRVLSHEYIAIGRDLKRTRLWSDRLRYLFPFAGAAGDFFIWLPEDYAACGPRIRAPGTAPVYSPFSMMTSPLTMVAT